MTKKKKPQAHGPDKTAKHLAGIAKRTKDTIRGKNARYDREVKKGQ
jgi:hypothetical protein